jgi:hypothetical protein
MTCSRCGASRRKLHRDHITPKWQGGADDEDNIQMLCANCHEDKTYEESQSPAFREAMRQLSLNLPEESVLKHLHAMNRPETRERQRQAQLNLSPEKRARITAGHQTQEFREKQAENTRARYARLNGVR